MRIRTLGIAALALCVTAPALADEVAQEELTTFQANTPAVASEVNANFTALLNAINDNAQRIAALESSAPSSSVAGSTYYLADTEVGIAGNAANDSFGRAFVFGGSGTLTFNADGTGNLSVSETESELGMVGGPPGSGTTFTLAPFPAGQGSIDVPFTYTQVGNVVAFTYTDDGDTDTETFQVSADGGVMLSLIVDQESDAGVDEFDVGMIIAIRVPGE